MIIEEIFKKNLKYINQIEMDVDTINRQFVKTVKRFYLTVGTVDLPTGRIVIGDPLAYLYTENKKNSPQLKYSVAPGSYPVLVALCRSRYTGIRMCTLKVKLKDTEVTKYEVAYPTEETAFFKAVDGIVSGFPVDAGMVAICDAAVADEYREFIGEWHKNNPNKNHYDDYFEEIFKESAKKLPQFQREDGDFTEWKLPESGRRMVMVLSGFGDGFYQVFWGKDKSEEICELIIPFVNPDIIDKAEEELSEVLSIRLM